MGIAVEKGVYGCWKDVKVPQDAVMGDRSASSVLPTRSASSVLLVYAHEAKQLMNGDNAETANSARCIHTCP